MIRRLFLVLFYATFSFVFSQNHYFETVHTFHCPEARQGVAVDRDHFYAIGSRQIGKYDKKTGERVAHWEEKVDGPIIHLDSGVVVEGKLVCSHSNYPEVPMTSSVEIWDVDTLEHQGSYSFGIRWGSCTWIDRYQDSWWASFAHYEKLKNQTGKGNRWTTVVQFNDTWQEQQSWIFPENVLNRFYPMSNSGGSWGPDNLLYCTGHDLGELYALRLPDSGSVLELISILPINNKGQGIAWDRNDRGVIYSIKKKERQVIVNRLIK